MSAAGPWMTEVRELKEQLKECKMCCDHIGCENIVVKSQLERAYRLLELCGLGYYPTARDVERELIELKELGYGEQQSN